MGRIWSGHDERGVRSQNAPPLHHRAGRFRTTFYSMVGQYGTHVDPPAHFRADGLTMDQIPLKDMILPLVVFDITPMLGSDPNHALSVDDIKTWEKVNGRVPSGAFAALRTDMSKDWESNPQR